MAQGTTRVEEWALTDLKAALLDAGETYKNQLLRLQQVINQIVAGDFTGDVADVFLAKFQEKEADFKSVATTIDEAEEYLGVKKTSFNNLVSELSSRMN